LATAADVGLSTIQKVEEVDGEPRVVSKLQWRSDPRRAWGAACGHPTPSRRTCGADADTACGFVTGHATGRVGDGVVQAAGHAER
jgi:hypothetical protein